MKAQFNMTAMKPIVALVITLSALLATPGCNGGGDKTAANAPSGPPAGSYVYVQFRRDFLGLHAPSPTAPTAEGMGASGTLKEVSREFIVLKVDNEAGRELWIPRDAVLMMDVRPAQ